MTFPTRVDRKLAVTAVQDFLNDLYWQARIAECGWEVSLKEELTLIVSLTAKSLGETQETFTLRLLCDYYPVYPPDVQFVNPTTHAYVLGRDGCHVADLRADYCYVHPNYVYQSVYPYPPQLVCSSMTLGYYFSSHAPTPEQVWQPGRHSIGTSIYTVYRALHSPDYYGRHTDDIKTEK
jgi:hypothetical protein